MLVLATLNAILSAASVATVLVDVRDGLPFAYYAWRLVTSLCCATAALFYLAGAY